MFGISFYIFKSINWVFPRSNVCYAFCSNLTKDWEKVDLSQSFLDGMK